MSKLCKMGWAGLVERVGKQEMCMPVTSWLVNFCDKNVGIMEG